MKAVILAGGLGTRMWPYTMFVPKPMFPLGEKPVLEHLIEWCKKNAITSIIICTSYLGKTIENYFESGNRFNVDIQYATLDRPMSTAGQLKSAQQYINDTFVCMYGDSIYGFNLKEMIKQHKQSKSFVTMSLFKNKTTLQYGVIETKNNRVVQWNEKPTLVHDINMGCYVFEKKILDMIPLRKQYPMDTLIRNIMKSRKKITSFIVKKGFMDIGDLDSYENAQNIFRKRLGKI